MKKHKKIHRIAVLLVAGLMASRTVLAVPEVPRENFGGLLTLDEAISRTLQEDAKVKAALERLEREKSLYKGAQAEFFPKFGTRFFGAVATGDSRTVGFFDTFIEQPLFEGGKSVFNKKKQKTRVESEALRFEEAKLDLNLDVRILYAGVLEEKELTWIAQVEVKELSGTQERVAALFKKEVIPASELMRVETLLQKAKTELVKHKEAYDYSLALLEETVAIDARESLDLEPLSKIPELSEDAGTYLEISRERDPVYKIAGLEIQEKEFERKMLRSERWPTINLAAKWDLDRDIYVKTDRVMTGISGTWNIWDFGRLNAQIHAKEHEIEQKKWEGIIAVREHEDEIRKLFHEIRAVREKIRLAETIVREREELYKNEKTKSVAGEHTASNLMDAFVALEEARTQNLEAVTECRILFSKLGRKLAFNGVETLRQGTEKTK